MSGRVHFGRIMGCLNPGNVLRSYEQSFHVSDDDERNLSGPYLGGRRLCLLGICTGLATRAGYGYGYSRVRVRVTVWVPVTRAQPATMPDVRQLGWVEVIFMSRVTH